MNATNSMTEKATEYARKVSENSRVFVYEGRDGVLFLALRHSDREGFRVLYPVGTDKTGIRYIKKSIDIYFADK